MTGCEILKCKYFKDNMCHDDSIYAHLGWCKYNDIWDTVEGHEMLAAYEREKEKE